MTLGEYVLRLKAAELQHIDRLSLAAEQTIFNLQSQLVHKDTGKPIVRDRNDLINKDLAVDIVLYGEKTAAEADKTRKEQNMTKEEKETEKRFKRLEIIGNALQEFQEMNPDAVI